MNYETITVRLLSGALGAEIGGDDLRMPFGNPQWSEIHQAFLAHSAIHIRNQNLADGQFSRKAVRVPIQTAAVKVIRRVSCGPVIAEKPADGIGFPTPTDR
jgi:alpha-ketoglutarate-dependent taurine dioxygenase